jgi:hypothetical protein
MNNQWILLIVLFLISFTLTGCTHRLAFGDCTYRVKTAECYQEFSQDADITATSFAAADILMRNATVELGPEHKVLITTLADIDNLGDSTSLGRLISEQLSARFAQRGYPVKEAKMYNHLIVTPYAGEFVLSRHLRETNLTLHADVVVAGTYAVGKNMIYITLKMLDSNTGKVIASYAYTLPIGPNTYALLQKTTWWGW